MNGISAFALHPSGLTLLSYRFLCKTVQFVKIFFPYPSLTHAGIEASGKPDAEIRDARTQRYSRKIEEAVKKGLKQVSENNTHHEAANDSDNKLYRHALSWVCRKQYPIDIARNDLC